MKMRYEMQKFTLLDEVIQGKSHEKILQRMVSLEERYIKSLFHTELYQKKLFLSEKQQVRTLEKIIAFFNFTYFENIKHNQLF